MLDLRAPEKKVEVEKVLISMSSDSFTELTAIGKQITDYTDEAPAAGGGITYIPYYKYFFKKANKYNTILLLDWRLFNYHLII